MENKRKKIIQDGEEFLLITTDEWVDFLSQEHIDPDYWCDHFPEDYGFKIIGDEY